MNAISKSMLKLKYKELSNINDATLSLISKNDVFKKNYKDIIEPFIIKNKNSINNELLNSIIKSILELDSKNNIDAFIKTIESQINPNTLIEVKNINPKIVLDKNYIYLYRILKEDIFDSDVTNTILEGRSDELVEFYQKIRIKDKIKVNSKILDFIKSNQRIKGMKIEDYFKDRYIDILIYVIDNNYLPGFLYAVENYSAVEDLLNNPLPEDKKTTYLKIFDESFMQNVGPEAYKQIIYMINSGKYDDIDTMFKIYDTGNYELIKDIIKYKQSDFKIAKNNEDKSIYEIVSKFTMNSIYIQKTFNMSYDNACKLRDLLTNINKLELPPEFKEKYQMIIDYLNCSYFGSLDDLKQINNKFNQEQLEFIKKEITAFVRESYLVQRQVFSSDLKDRFDSFNNGLNSKPLLDENKQPIVDNKGKGISVYELEGQPFTMMIHCVTNKGEKNGNGLIAKQLLGNPTVWNTQEDGNKYVNCSIISNSNMSNFGGKIEHITYGFSNVPANMINKTKTSDGGTRMNNYQSYEYEESNDDILQIDDLSKPGKNLIQKGGGGYNEIIVNRKNGHNERLQPNYIVCFDEVDPVSIKHAQYFGIPIYVINTRVYQEQFDQIIESMNTSEEYSEGRTR